MSSIFRPRAAQAVVDRARAELGDEYAAKLGAHMTMLSVLRAGVAYAATVLDGDPQIEVMKFAAVASARAIASHLGLREEDQKAAMEAIGSDEAQMNEEREREELEARVAADDEAEASVDELLRRIFGPPNG